MLARFPAYDPWRCRVWRTRLRGRQHPTRRRSVNAASAPVSGRGILNRSATRVAAAASDAQARGRAAGGPTPPLDRCPHRVEVRGNVVHRRRRRGVPKQAPCTAFRSAPRAWVSRANMTRRSWGRSRGGARNT